MSRVVTYGGRPKPQALCNSPRNGVGAKKTFHRLGLLAMCMGVQSFRHTRRQHPSRNKTEVRTRARQRVRLPRLRKALNPKLNPRPYLARSTDWRSFRGSEL